MTTRMGSRIERPADQEDAERQDFDSVTRDRFFRGAFEVLQPVGTGHRSGSDALLLAAALPVGAAGRLADLGAGAGVAGMAALAANPDLSGVLVEIDAAMARLARRSLALDVNRRIAARAEVLNADATLSGTKREAAGLANASFDHVIVNPPYNYVEQRPPGDPLKALAHMMGAGGLDPWMRTAAAILKPGGMLHLIYRTEKLGEIIACAQGRFGGLTIVPLHARADAVAGRIIVRAIRASKARLAIAPGIVLHEADGKSTPLADDLVNGRARLNFATGD